jgi:N-acetylneuraminic acid mutarotase
MKTRIQNLLLKTMKTSSPDKPSSYVAVAVIISGLLLCGNGNVFAQSGTWTNIASMPTNVAYGSGVACGGQFYVVDGARGGGWVTVPLQVYDPTNNSWSLKTADPVDRADAVAGVINNKIFVAEGWIHSNEGGGTTNLEIYDPSVDSWTAGAPSLVQRAGSVAAVIGGKLYITGGVEEFYAGDIATLEIYDSTTDTWTNGAPIPVASETAVGAAINGKFYVVGGGVRPAGGTAQPDPATTNVFIYDPASDTWISGAPMPSPRAGAQGGVINGRLFITGGDNVNGTNNPVVVYDPLANTWSSAVADPLLHPAAAAAVVNGELFVAGGIVSGNTISTAEAFTPSPLLNIAPFGNQSVLFWSASATNFVLQSTANLASPNWITASDAVPVIAVTVTNTTPARFFRLQQQ